jgi:hypothetical protein
MKSFDRKYDLPVPVCRHNDVIGYAGDEVTAVYVVSDIIRVAVRRQFYAMQTHSNRKCYDLTQLQRIITAKQVVKTTRQAVQLHGVCRHATMQ